MKKFALMFDDRAFFLPGIHGYWFCSNGLSTLRPKRAIGQHACTILAGNFGGHKVDLVATSDLKKTLSYKRANSVLSAGG